MEPVNAMDAPYLEPEPPPRVRRAVLHLDAGPALADRLHAYLAAMAVPPDLAADWAARATQGGVDGEWAFARLRTQIATYWRTKTGSPGLDEDTAVAQARLCRWLAPANLEVPAACPAAIAGLFDLPPLRRRSMTPEPWSD